MIKIVPFEMNHYKLLTPDREIHGLENHLWLKKIPGNDQFMTVSVLLDGRCLGILGIYSPVKGLGRCWAILSEEIKRHGIFLFRSVKQMIDKIFSFGVITKMESDILVGNKKLQRWITKLGFRFSYTAGKVDVYERGV